MTRTGIQLTCTEQWHNWQGQTMTKDTQFIIFCNVCFITETEKMRSEQPLMLLYHVASTFNTGFPKFRGENTARQK